MPFCMKEDARILTLPPKLGVLIARRLPPWCRAQLASSCRWGHVVACASIERLVLRSLDAPQHGRGTTSHGGGGLSKMPADAQAANQRRGSTGNLAMQTAPLDISADGPPFASCASVCVKPRTPGELSKLVAALLLPGPLQARLPAPAPREVSLQIGGACRWAPCDLSLHLTSLALHARHVARLSVTQPGALTVREAAAVARLAGLEHLELYSALGLEPGALAALAAASGARARLKTLHIERTMPSHAAECGGATVVDAQQQRQLELPCLLPADAVALAGLAPTLASLSLVGLAPQLAGARVQPWVALLDEAARLGGSPLERFVVRGCGAVGAGAIAALAQLPRLAHAELCCDADAGSLSFGGSSLAPLLHLSSLKALGVAVAECAAPAAAAAAALPISALASWPPGAFQQLENLSVGGLSFEGSSPTVALVDGGVAPQLHTLHIVANGDPCCSGPGGAGVNTATNVGGSIDRSDFSHQQDHRMLPLSVAAPALGHPARLAAALPRLAVLDIAGGWELDPAGVAALAGLLSAPSPRLARLRLRGTPSRPLPASAVAPLLAAVPPPGARPLAALELGCVAGLTDAAVEGLAKAAPRCVFRSLRELKLNAAPSFFGGVAAGQPLAVPSSPQLGGGAVLMTAAQAAQKLAAGKAPSTAAAIAAAAKAAAVAASSLTSAITSSPRPQKQQQHQQEGLAATMTDRGLVRLFACRELRRLELCNLPLITLAGVAALCRGLGALESVRLASCRGVGAPVATRDEAAAAGILGSRFVHVEVCP